LNSSSPWYRFGRKTPEEREALIREFLPSEERAFFMGTPPQRQMAETMIEAAAGQIPIPLGIADGYLINQERLAIPMATEEPSVAAASRFAASLIARGGGFTAEADKALIIAQVFLSHCGDTEEALKHSLDRILEKQDFLKKSLQPLLASMESRGGGWHSLRGEVLPRTATVKLEILLDVRDSMGANKAIALAEKAAPLAAEICSGRKVMAICSNASDLRCGRASFSLPLDRLTPGGSALAEQIVLAADIAREDRNRAVTHNKGIMNGVSALALATGNDTRALEAAVHSFACRSGSYQPLTRYAIKDHCLTGQIELPLPLASKGGTVESHPSARAAFRIMGFPDSQKLMQIAASLGLAQNFAALRALVSEGISQGHMALHRRKFAASEDR